MHKQDRWHQKSIKSHPPVKLTPRKTRMPPASYGSFSMILPRMVWLFWSDSKLNSSYVANAQEVVANSSNSQGQYQEFFIDLSCSWYVFRIPSCNVHWQWHSVRCDFRLFWSVQQCSDFVCSSPRSTSGRSQLCKLRQKFPLGLEIANWIKNNSLALPLGLWSNRS